MSEEFRVDALPPYTLSEIQRLATEARNKGRDVINLSQINPDLGPQPEALDKLVQACLLPHNHRYSSSQGVRTFRAAAARFYLNKLGVALDEEQELSATMGAKEGLAHLLLAMLQHGDGVLMPTPHYPVHGALAGIAGAQAVTFPLTSPEGRFSNLLDVEHSYFIQSLQVAYENAWPRPRVLLLSFPHNPTGICVTERFIQELVDFAVANELLLIHDFAYAGLGYGDYQPPSFLAAEGAKDCVVEILSFSKSLGLAGWRVGVAAGMERAISALKKLKSYTDFGIFQPLQLAAAVALDNADSFWATARSEYQSRRDCLASSLAEAGWEFILPLAGVSLWARPPAGLQRSSSQELARMLLEQCDIAASPGAGFGDLGEGFLRFALVENETRLQRAREKLLAFSGEAMETTPTY